MSNANYLWISYFVTALNKNGQAGLVMANSASDSGSNDLIIRQNMIRAEIIKQMVTLPSNMFTSVTLPATLWFFDKNKDKDKDKKDEILFIDARNVFTKIDRAHRKFSDEQIKNLGIITRLYEGDKKAFLDLIYEYKECGKVKDKKEYFDEQINWLNERFPNGEYQDVIGLCKVVKLGEIYDKDGNMKETLKRVVKDSLDRDLPEIYSKELFQAKTNILMDVFIDKSVQGLRIA